MNRLSTETNPESAVVTLTYNGKDEVTGYDDPRHVHTTYVRDGFGDVIRRDSPDTGITDYWYDPRGLLTKMVDARAVETDFTYDNAGRRLTKTFPAAPGENVAYGYDGGSRGVGRLTGINEVAGGAGTKWGAKITATPRILQTHEIREHNSRRPAAVATAVMIHHSCRIVSSAAAVPGSSGANPNAGAAKNARKPPNP